MFDDAVSQVVDAIVGSRKMTPEQSKIVEAIGKSRGMRAINEAVEAGIVVRWQVGKSVLLTLTPLACQHYSLKPDNDRRFILKGERETEMKAFSERKGTVRESDADDGGAGFSLDSLADPRMLDAMASSLRFEANVARVRASYPEFFAATA